LSVDATDTLTLSGVTVDGGTINDGTGSTLATSGKIEISGSSTISNAGLNNGGVTVDAKQTLTLDNDTVTGTTFTDTASGAIIQIDDGKTMTARRAARRSPAGRCLAISTSPATARSATPA
jgi:hypothetical protein